MVDNCRLIYYLSNNAITDGGLRPVRLVSWTNLVGRWGDIIITKIKALFRGTSMTVTATTGNARRKREVIHRNNTAPIWGTGTWADIICSPLQETIVRRLKLRGESFTLTMETNDAETIIQGISTEEIPGRQ